MKKAGPVQYENPFSEEPQRWQNPPSGPEQSQQNATAGGSASMPRWVIPVLALVVVVIVALLVQVFLLMPKGSSSSASSSQGSTTQVIVTEWVEPSSEEPIVPEQPSTVEQATVVVPAGPALPSYASSVGDNVYTSGPTSNAFAHEVARQWRSDYGSSHTGDGSVRAYSPVTGSTYTMNCTNYQTYVHCQGGNNANVYIQ